MMKWWRQETQGGGGGGGGLQFLVMDTCDLFNIVPIVSAITSDPMLVQCVRLCLLVTRYEIGCVSTCMCV